MEGASRPALLLLGAGGEAFATRLLAGIPSGAAACTPPATCRRTCSTRT